MQIKNPFLLLDTENPNEKAFATLHDQESLAQITTTGNNGWPIEGVTLYKDWFLRLSERSQGQDGNYIWGNYVFFDKKSEGGVLTFIWVKEKTVAQAAVPFREETSFRPFDWDTVIKFIKPIPDYTAQRSSIRLKGGVQGWAQGPEYYAQFGVIPGGRYGTKITRRWFLGPRPFNIGRSPTPVGTAVSLMLPGRELIHFPSALHQKIEIERLITSSAQTLAGTGSGSASSVEGQVFPSTEPFEDWKKHVFLRDQKRTETGYLSWEDSAIPPDQPDIIVSFTT